MPSQATRKLFARVHDVECTMLTYDDVRIRTRHSEIVAADPSIDLTTRFSKRVALNIPIVSSPMDKVTTAPMAIAMAEAGGLGVIHRGLSPEAQAKEVERVKYRVNGRVETPIVVSSDMTIAAVRRMIEERKFLFETFPVVDSQGKMLGMLTGSDFDFCIDDSMRVTEVMTPLAGLITGNPETTADQAYELMQKHKKKALPTLGLDGTTGRMYVYSDLRRMRSKRSIYNVDENGQLRVGAAVGVGALALKRAELLARKKCDVFQIDTAHGDSKNVIETLKLLKVEYPHIDVVAGNVSSGESAKRLADEGADGVLVGQGPGSICTTRVIAGVGVPQASAVYECAQALEGSGVPVCADGGIRYSGDGAIALALGAANFMVGRALAGTEEAPGETRLYQGKLVKDYRGMGSLGAMRDNASSRERYGQGKAPDAKLVPEGVEGIVPYQGPVQAVLDQYVGGLRSSMAYEGARTILEFIEVARVFRMPLAGNAESHPHDVTIVQDPPNYQRRS